MNIIIRDIPASVIARIDEIARQSEQSRQQLLHTLLCQTYDSGIDPQIMIGFVELVNGELDENWICPECNQPLGDKRLYLGFDGALRTVGPVCEVCAITE